ncbi:tumor necrosis factor receptor superfamily member 10B-like isoform X2 [Phasianus colchicus]|uniref:tumor necrosis factor receptor superfamily member 10B-like isoform X2 n=1 Tax=Phasianus colchicus TaxID=9054 RepID=UPI00129D2961|nr:tumor necrosis factor receptor superfamily member 10B-like isoform X2 [Phasianus colchicus]
MRIRIAARAQRTMRSAALRFCPVLKLLLANVHLGSAVAVKNWGGESDVLEPDLYSNKCPMGTYLANDSSKCLPCKEHEYTEHPNDFSKCLGCRTCREDEVEVSPCIRTRNTQCACKNGTFCLPDHPCEMCQKCQTQCPKGEVRIAPCTQHSDLQCAPFLDISSMSTDMIVIIVMAVVLVFLLLFACFCCIYCRKSEGDHGPQMGGPPPTGCGQEGDVPWRRRVTALLFLPGNGGELCRKPSAMVEVAPTTSNPNVETQKKLVPVPGGDPITVLSSSFNTFADHVPLPEWKRFGRVLGLLENKLYEAEQKNGSSGEPLCQMLNTWLNKEGSKASVNTLLEALSQINLSGVADIIASKLIRDGYFQYEMS